MAVKKNVAPMAPVEEAPKAPAVGKVYKFKSANKFLTCANLGVQFVNGFATTTNLAVARELVKLEGVELVEE